MDWFESFVKHHYLKPKNERSIGFMRNAPKLPLPKLGKADSKGALSLKELNSINTHLGKLKYTLDPLNGLLDFYNHPGYTEWRLQNDRTDQPCDCDDFAYYAKGLMHTCGAKSSDSWIWTIAPGFWDQFTQAKWNHVLCGFRFVEKDGQEWTGVMDTNTAYHQKIFWFPFPKEEAKPHILKLFKSIYPANYAHLIESEYVF